MNGAAANGAMNHNQAQNATEQLGAAEAGNMMQEQAQTRLQQTTKHSRTQLQLSKPRWSTTKMRHKMLA